MLNLCLSNGRISRLSNFLFPFRIRVTLRPIHSTSLRPFERSLSNVTRKDLSSFLFLCLPFDSGTNLSSLSFSLFPPYFLHPLLPILHLNPLPPLFEVSPPFLESSVNLIRSRSVRTPK